MLRDLLTDIESISDYSSTSKCQHGIPDQDMVIQTGVLDTNCYYPKPGPQSLSKLRVSIKTRHDRRALTFDQYEQRASAMTDEAEEHNELLLQLCKTDKEYELCLLRFFYRKLQISDLLG